MIEKTVEIATKDGACTTFVVHPERDGPHPLILFLMDAPAIREELRDMCRRIAAVGYYVMLPNLYYRQGVMEIWPMKTDADRARMFELMNSLTIPLVMDDAAAMLAYADADPAAKDGPAAVLGYCMSGRYAINAAARWPERFKAAASLHGTHLVEDAPDSPHKVAKQAKGELYFACAEIDRWAPPETVAALKAALAADGVTNAEVEDYPGVEHGFTFPQRPAYDKPSAERHWERLFAMWRRNLN